jgi:hypothetical protein
MSQVVRCGYCSTQDKRETRPGEVVSVKLGRNELEDKEQHVNAERVTLTLCKFIAESARAIRSLNAEGGAACIFQTHLPERLR